VGSVANADAGAIAENTNTKIWIRVSQVFMPRRVAEPGVLGTDTFRCTGRRGP
jgi:hypothetical protein